VPYTNADAFLARPEICPACKAEWDAAGEDSPEPGAGYKPEAAVLYDGTPASGSIRRATWGPEDCGECGGRGTLTRLGGDWGKTPDTDVTCWRCKGTGRR